MTRKQRRAAASLRRRRSAATDPTAAKLQRALSHHRAGRLAAAVGLYNELLSDDPDNVDALHLLGVAKFQAGDLDAAVDLIERVIARRPDFAEAHNNLGNALRERGQADAALAAYEKALALKPAYADASNNLGVLLRELGRPAEAEAACRTALELRPDFARAHNNLGNALGDQGRLDEAISAYRAALRRDPGYAQAHYNLGTMLRAEGKLEHAVAAFKRAVAKDPGFGDAQAALFEALQHLCDWRQLDDLGPRLDAATEAALSAGARTPESPFLSLARSQDPARHLAVARAWSADAARRMAPFKSKLPARQQRAPGGRVRLGYLSRDFRAHAVAHLAVGLFGLHDRDAFEVWAYSYGPDDGSDYRRRIERDSDRFVDLRALSPLEAARRIRADGIDVLVDLTGFTRGARPEICALAPAPIQVSWLGFPGTSGADYIDYLLADRVVAPEEQAPHYSEKLVHLPHCYQITDHDQAIAETRPVREDAGLPADDPVFCSFNQSYKIEPVMWQAWMRLLDAVPGSVLWLLEGNQAARGNLRREAAARGVAPERIVFAGRMAKPEHLARLGLADLFLDTRLYNAHTTASDALWAGVPVLTLEGKSFASRVAASLLGAIGLPELITRSLDDYEALALALARDRQRLAEIRERLRRNRLSAPLFDTPRFVRALERGYRMMWELHAAGQPPRPLAVPDGD